MKNVTGFKIPKSFYGIFGTFPKLFWINEIGSTLAISEAANPILLISL